MSPEVRETLEREAEQLRDRIDALDSMIADDMRALAMHEEQMAKAEKALAEHVAALSLTT